MKRSLFTAGTALLAIVLSGCASLQDKAEAGDPAAQWQLADCMMTGNGYPQNPGLAKQWLEKAIASENAEAIALKGEYMASGRYGKNPDIEKALEMMEPAVLQGSNRRIAYGFLKTVFAHHNYNHFPACAKAIETAYGYERDDFEDEDCKRRWELALMFTKEMPAFMTGAYNKEKKMRLAEQVTYMRGLQSFIANGQRYNHEWNEHEREYGRADKYIFQPEYIKTVKVIEELNRTAEIEGIGRNAAECAQDAQKKAVIQLCGVNVTSSESLKQSEEVKNDKANEQSRFDNKISANVSDRLSSFSVIIAPKIQPDGSYKGVYRATARAK